MMESDPLTFIRQVWYSLVGSDFDPARWQEQRIQHPSEKMPAYDGRAEVCEMEDWERFCFFL
jgi:hypothetical protein